MPVVPAENEIRILTPNFLDENNTYELSHGGNIALIYDRDNDSKYITNGADRDTIEATITVTFKINGAETEFLLSSLIIINHNLKEWTFKIWQAGAWVEQFGEVDNANNFACYTFGTLKTSRIQICMKKTHTPNKEKYIGELIVARQRFSLPPPIGMEHNFREMVTTIDLINGERHRAYTRFSPNRTQKYGAAFSWQFLSRENYNIIRCLKDEATPFLWYPESITRPDEVWYVYIVNAFSPKYSTLNVNNGYSITLQLEEV